MHGEERGRSRSRRWWQPVLVALGLIAVAVGGVWSGRYLLVTAHRGSAADAGPAPPATPVGSWAEQLRALARVGDLPGLRAHLATEVSDAGSSVASRGDARLQGSWLCLLGEQAAGRRVLREALLRLIAEPRSGEPAEKPRLARALLACGATGSAAETARAQLKIPDGLRKLRHGSFDPEATAQMKWDVRHLEYVARAVASSASDEQLLERASPFDLEQVLMDRSSDYYLDSMRVMRHQPFSPWNAWAPCHDEEALSPKVLLAGAERALERARTVSAALSGPASRCGGSGCPAPPPAGPYFRRLATTLRYLAAFELSRRGAAERARAVLGEAEQDDPAPTPSDSPSRILDDSGAEVLARAAVHLAADAPETGLALWDGVDPQNVAAVSQHALMLAALDRWAEAWPLVRDAPHTGTFGNSIGWLRAALAIQVGQEHALTWQHDVSFEPDDRGVIDGYTKAPRFWWHLRSLEPNRRKALLPRVQLAPPPLHLGPFPVLPARPGFRPLPPEVLPATLRVIAAATDHPEPLLDRLIANAHLCAGARLFPRAALEQARWRGDHAAIRRWQARLDRLLELIEDDASAELAELVHL